MKNLKERISPKKKTRKSSESESLKMMTEEGDFVEAKQGELSYNPPIQVKPCFSKPSSQKQPRKQRTPPEGFRRQYYGQKGAPLVYESINGKKDDDRKIIDSKEEQVKLGGIKKDEEVGVYDYREERGSGCLNSESSSLYFIENKGKYGFTRRNRRRKASITIQDLDEGQSDKVSASQDNKGVTKVEQQNIDLDSDKVAEYKLNDKQLFKYEQRNHEIRSDSSPDNQTNIGSQQNIRNRQEPNIQRDENPMGVNPRIQVPNRQRDENPMINNFIQNDGQQNDGQQNRQEQKSGAKRRVIIAAIIIIALLVLGVAGFLIWFYTRPLSPQPAVIVEPEKEKPDPPTQQLILERNFQNYNVYMLEYLLNTQMSEDYSIQILYNVIFVVYNQSEIQNGSMVTNFGAVIQKRYEKKINQNGTVEEEKPFDQSNIFEEILRYGTPISNQTNNATNSTEEQIDGSITCQELKQQLNQTFQCTSTAIPVFDFSLKENGKIHEFVFPTDMDRQSLGLLRTFVKMFSPLLDKNLYENKMILQNTKKLRSAPLYSDDEDNEYTEAESFDSYESNGSLVLEEDSSVSAQTDTHDTFEESSQKSSFQGNELTATSLESDTEFINSEQTNQTSNDKTLYSAEPLDLGLNYTSHQQCNLKVIQKFESTQEHVTVFKQLLENYSDDNKTLEVTVEGLINYILDVDEQDFAHPGQYRLLLEEDGSLSLIKYDKNIRILGTNVIGFKIGAFGYVKLNLNLYENKENPYKKQPIFTFDAGAILALGVKQFSFSLVDYQKQLPPLTLKYTLEQIETVIDILKSGFIKDVIDISKLAFRGDFDGRMLPLIQNIVSKVDDLVTVIDQEHNKNSPIAVLNQVYAKINLLQEIYQSKGLALLNSDDEHIKDLTSGLLKFVNVSYQEALQVFTQTKDLLSTVRSDSLGYINKMKTVFLSRNISEINDKIMDLIPPEIYEKYAQQIKKAQKILDTLVYIEEKGGHYFETIQQYLNVHEQNMLKMVSKVMDLYFDNETFIAEAFIDQMQEKLEKTKDQYEDFKSKLAYIQSIGTRSESYLMKIASATDIGLSNHRTDFDAKINHITNLAHGASNEKHVGCCKWYRVWYTLWTAKKCSYYNDGAGAQGSQPTIWSATKQQIYDAFLNTTKAAEAFIANVTIVLNEDTDGIPEKIMKIQQKYYQTIGKYPLNTTMLLKRIDDNLAQARSARSQVRCGSHGSLDALIVQLGGLKNYVSAYGTIFSTFNSTYHDTISKFNVSIFNTIMSESTLTPTTQEFLEKYDSYADNVTAIFNKLAEIQSDFEPHKFVEDQDLAVEMYGVYQDLINIIKQQCLDQEQNSMMIEQIRKQYLQKLENIKNMASEPLGNDLEDLRSFLSATSQGMFTLYLNTPFCEISNNFHANITTLFPDFDNFTVLYSLWEQLKQIKNESLSFIDKSKAEWQSFEGIFYQLFTPAGFESFIYKTSNLTSNITEFVHNTSVKLSQIRQRSKEVLVFMTATESELTEAFLAFNSSEFKLTASQTFTEISQYVEQSLAVIKQLSFDIITVVVAGKNVKQFFEKTIEQFKDGIHEIKREFLDICQNFINLDRMVTQSYLEDLDSSLKGMLTTFNLTVFPNITIGLQEIKDKYSGYKFADKSMEKLFDNSMDSLIEFGGIMDTAKTNVYVGMQEFINKAMQLIEKLEIGSLNSLHRLANTVKEQFEVLLGSFKKIIKKILNYPKSVVQDFHNLYKLPDLLSDIKQEVRQTFKSVNQTILRESQRTLTYLQNNSDFYAKLKESEIYEALKKIETGGLTMNVEELWTDSDGQDKLEEIEELIKSITGNIQDFLQRLSNAKNKIKSIKENVNEKIKYIKKEFNILKRKFSNLQSLIFITLSADLQKVIMGSLHNIIHAVDEIVDVQFYSIGQIAESQFNASAIKNVVDEVVSFYGILKDKRYDFMQPMHEALISADKFLQSKVATKMQKLKDGLLYIKAQGNLQNPIQTYELYHKKIDEKRMPIWQYKQVIPTAIGTFIISLDLNYTLGAYAFIQLREYRNIDMGVNFTAALVVQVAFSYGLAHILEFGLYVRGNILRASVIPKIEMNGVIPIQLIKAIADIQQISNENRITIDFVTDLELYALEIQVGFFIKHIWLQLIWIRINLCFDFWFINFCVNFRIPIGFKIVFKRHDFGYKIRGIPIAEKRILDLRLLDFKV